MNPEKLAQMAAEVAERMLQATAGMTDETEPLAGDNSRKRSIDPELRARFIAVRTWMQRMGLVDPVLNRFDTYTVAQATSRDVAEELRRVAESMVSRA